MISIIDLTLTMEWVTHNWTALFRIFIVIRLRLIHAAVYSVT